MAFGVRPTFLAVEAVSRVLITKTVFIPSSHLKWHRKAVQQYLHVARTSVTAVHTGKVAQ